MAVGRWPRFHVPRVYSSMVVVAARGRCVDRPPSAVRKIRPPGRRLTRWMWLRSMAICAGMASGMGCCGSDGRDGSRRRQQRTGLRGRGRDTAADGLGEGPAVRWIFSTAFKASGLARPRRRARCGTPARLSRAVGRGPQVTLISDLLPSPARAQIRV